MSATWYVWSSTARYNDSINYSQVALISQFYTPKRMREAWNSNIRCRCFYNNYHCRNLLWNKMVLKRQNIIVWNLTLSNLHAHKCRQFLTFPRFSREIYNNSRASYSWCKTTALKSRKLNTTTTLFDMHGKNDFAEGSKIFLNTDLKIILLDHQNNSISVLKIMNVAKNFDILAISLNVLQLFW